MILIFYIYVLVEVYYIFQTSSDSFGEDCEMNIAQFNLSNYALCFFLWIHLGFKAISESYKESSLSGCIDLLMAMMGLFLNYFAVLFLSEYLETECLPKRKAFEFFIFPFKFYLFSLVMSVIFIIKNEDLLISIGRYIDNLSNYLIPDELQMPNFIYRIRDHQRYDVEPRIVRLRRHFQGGLPTLNPTYNLGDRFSNTNSYLNHKMKGPFGRHKLY